MTTGFRFPPFARPGMRPPPAPQPVEEQLPSIDQFLDELPPIDDFLAGEEPPFAEAETTLADAGEWSPVPEEISEPQYIPPVSPARQPAPAEGWADGAWQSFDWGSLASLNRHSPVPSQQAWGETEWPSQVDYDSTGFRTDSGTPGADEIADALDGIARRIRSGELIIDNLRHTPPEAAMAAALAVILRMRG